MSSYGRDRHGNSCAASRETGMGLGTALQTGMGLGTALQTDMGLGTALQTYMGLGTAVQPAERQALLWEQLCSRQRDRHCFGNSCAAGRETGIALGTAVQPAT